MFVFTCVFVCIYQCMHNVGVFVHVDVHVCMCVLLCSYNYDLFSTVFVHVLFSIVHLQPTHHHHHERADTETRLINYCHHQRPQTTVCVCGRGGGGGIRVYPYLSERAAVMALELGRLTDTSVKQEFSNKQCHHHLVTWVHDRPVGIISKECARTSYFTVTTICCIATHTHTCYYVYNIAHHYLLLFGLESVAAPIGRSMEMGEMSKKQVRSATIIL